MDLDYASSTTATASTPGNFAGQVTSASVWTWNGTAVIKVPIAAYKYNAKGQLVEARDPRIEAAGAPALVTKYTYDVAGRLTTVTAPGEEPYSFGYGQGGASRTGSGDLIDAGPGRLLSVKRASLTPGTKDQLGPDNTTTVVYDVPLTRAKGGPYDLNAAALATWAQSDGPTDATAVFGPQDVPSVTTATETAPGKDGYKPATVHYLNSSGREVNTASPAGKDAPVEGFIDTAEYDRFGNTVRTLDATNRLLALRKLPNAAAMLTDWGLDNKTGPELSVLLDSRSTYSPDGLDVLTETGPVQRLAVANDPNDVRLLRPRTVNVYDEGNPEGAAAHLLTRSTSAGIDPFATVADVLIDPIVTTNEYSPVDGKPALDPTSGWVHKQATKITVDAGQPTALSSVVLYDARGRAIESRKPGSTGNDAGTTRTEFYVAEGTAAPDSCAGRPEWAGLSCKTWTPGVTGIDAARMGTTTPTVHIQSYNAYRNPLVTVTTGSGPAGTLSRTTTATFDAADRVTRSTTTEAGPGAGAAIAPTVFSYESASGRLVREAAVNAQGTETSAITREYDRLGGLVKYTDSSGAWTTTTYDRWGKTAETNNSIGTKTSYTYDRAVEPRGLVTKITDSVAGDIQPTWGPDGQLESQLLPGGVKLTIGYDPGRVPVSRTYTKAADGAPIAADSVVENHKGQWVRHTSTAADSAHTDRTYFYDRLGRLTQTREALGDAANSCQVREYAFDAHGNRTNLRTTRGTGTDPVACAGTATDSPTTYDTADRVVTTSGAAGNSWTYDGLGRATSVPTSDSSAAANLGYFVNDLAALQEVPQASKTTWTLDAAKRYSASTTAAWDVAAGAWGTATTSRNAYDGDGDRPAWTIENVDTPANLTRYVDGPDGDLVMTTGKDGGRKLLLTDLHGDTLATVPIADGSTTATWGSLRFSANDEYGNPLALSSGAAETSRYSWHATAQRAFTAGLGAILMGARLYLPHTGTFTTIDPVPGGNTTAYAYPQDPINSFDLDGRMNWKKWSKRLKTVGKWVGVAGAAACIVASAGLCAVAGAVGLGIAAASSAASWRAGEVSGKRALINFGVEGLLSVVPGARSMKLVGRHSGTVVRSLAISGARGRHAAIGVQGGHRGGVSIVANMRHSARELRGNWQVRTLRTAVGTVSQVGLGYRSYKG